MMSREEQRATGARLGRAGAQKAGTEHTAASFLDISVAAGIA